MFFFFPSTFPSGPTLLENAITFRIWVQQRGLGKTAYLKEFLFASLYNCDNGLKLYDCGSKIHINT